MDRNCTDETALVGGTVYHLLHHIPPLPPLPPLDSSYYSILSLAPRVHFIDTHTYIGKKDYDRGIGQTPFAFENIPYLRTPDPV